MVAVGYLFYNANVRVKDGDKYEFVGLENGPPTKGYPTVSSVKERAECVFREVKKRIKNLVIVNSSLSTSDLIQACAEVAEKYADNVSVIQPLLARITYGLEILAKNQHFPEDEVILIVTITTAFNEFVILRRDSNLQLFIAECETFEPNQRKKMFAKYYANCKPTSTIFIVQRELEHVADQLKEQFNIQRYFIRSYNKWDYVILFGGMLRAMEDEDGFNSKYHVANFSSGFETTVQQNKTQERRHVLLPNRSPLPCKIFGFNGPPQKIKISYCEQFHFMGNEHTVSKRFVVERPFQVSGSSKEVIGYVDERGVPFFPPPKGVVESTKKMPSATIPELNKKDVKVHVLAPVKSSTFGRSMPSYAGILSQQPSSSANNFQMSAPPSRQIKFVFHDNFYAVEIFRNGITRVLANPLGHEWTPLYFSTANGTWEFGEKAKTYCEKFPKHVIYDLWEVIGKPMNQIKIKREWGFGLIVDKGILYYQIETPSGARLIPQETVVAAFLKNMKIRVESNLDAQIKEIHISTNFRLNESQKAIFVKAADKTDLKVLSFV